MRKRHTLTVIALIVIVILSCLIVLISSSSESPMEKNERLAIQRLKYLSTNIFPLVKSTVLHDDNNNSIGEYAFFPTIFNIKSSLSWEHGLSPNTISINMKDGSFSIDGYIYNVYLPDGSDSMFGYSQYIHAPNKNIGADLREQYYVIYATPIERYVTGRRTFFIGQNSSLEAFSISAQMEEFDKDPKWDMFYGNNTRTFLENLKQGPKPWRIQKQK